MNRADITKLMPQQGNMMLLDTLEEWSTDFIICSGWSPGLASHPLSEIVDSVPRLCASNCLEYAAQALALHGILKGHGGKNGPKSAFVAGLQEVFWRKDELEDADWPLKLRGDAVGGLGDTGAKYDICVSNASGEKILSGKALVMFADTPPGE